MALPTRTRRAGQVIRVPVEVIRRRPHVVGHVLGLALDMPMSQVEQYGFSYGWEDPEAGGIIIIAQGPEDGPPILLECTWIRKYRTLVTVYEITKETPQWITTLVARGTPGPGTAKGPDRTEKAGT